MTGRDVFQLRPEYYRWTQWIFLQMYNSWFDSSTSRARPIADLTQMLEAGEVVIDLEGKLFRAGEVRDSQTLRAWVSLSEQEKESVPIRNGSLTWMR